MGNWSLHISSVSHMMNSDNIPHMKNFLNDKCLSDKRDAEVYRGCIAVKNYFV
ncbi:hypothetical protein Lser_V15G33141 [Lactuca serriola]